MSISFNQIPINVRTPGQYIEFDNTRAVQGLPAIWHRILVLGQRLNTGSVAAGVPVQILSGVQAEGYFGRGSMLAAMLAALKAANTYTECWAVGLDDNGAGASATGTIAFSNSPTESGTLNLYVGGQLVQYGVASGASATAIAAGVAAAINADTSLPVTASAAAGNVTLTARHKGEAGNSIDVRLNYQVGQATPKGLTVVITPMAGGTANPDIQTAITAIGDEQYHTVVVPYTDATNLGKVESLLSTRFGPMVQKEGHAFTAAAGSHATLVTLGNGRNSPHLTIMGAGKSPTPPYVWAAVAGAVDAFEPDPARPRQTLELPGVLAPAMPDRWTRDERNLLLYAGIATTLETVDGRVLFERVITTYKTNAFGVPDISYLDVETMRTIAYLRFSVRSRIALKFPRFKLADDGTQFGAGQAIVTPRTIRAELLALFIDWEEAGLVEGREQFKRDLIVERNKSDPNRVDAIIPPDVVNQFRVFAGQVQFRL
ncbi:MAG: phage tail sheath subtilisin-like domain-containing protein [Piscinibacter sp.]|uniref:phage tail sheath subtilisin-like domain-containing protein n=1 Tax=Piscinibacter sp. TaxID=1903157 RepID=UPI002587CA08|nr:phage tail sheath subtilisin-like domain-containing protein [Piscinibacter sp.]MCW5666478.1 phage tail sheath subtilisin-like domain-containing protein [Piscinibacter sp.]